MTQEEILEYNKRCAEFLGWKFEDKIWLKPHPKEFNRWIVASYSKTFVNFCYDWNWIMEVVEAIEKELDGSRPFKYGKLDALDFNIGNKSIKVKASFWTNPNTVNGNYWSYFKYNKKYNNVSKKEAVVQAINQFLIWYNNEH